MKSERFLQELCYLPDRQILEADPRNFPVRQSPVFHKILAIRTLAAAAVLCIVVGILQFRSSDPGGSPSANLPPATSRTDIPGDGTDPQDGVDRDLPPHFHYQGNWYALADLSENKGISADGIPEGYAYVGTVDGRESCRQGGEDHITEGDLSLYGTNDACAVYMDADGACAYMDNGDGVYYKYKLTVFDSGEDGSLLQHFHYQGNCYTPKPLAEAPHVKAEMIPKEYTYVGDVSYRASCWKDDEDHVTEGDLSLYGSFDGFAVYMNEDRTRAYLVFKSGQACECELNP